MRILFVSAEATPFAKVGGLADVAAALPTALRRLGHDARLIMPRYASIDAERHRLRPLPVAFTVSGEHGEPVSCGLLEGRIGDLLVYLVEEARYLNRPEVYGAADDLDRFILFSRAVPAAVEALDWRPDVLQANDWHTAILPAWLSLGLAGEFLGGTAGVLTIHNLAFQGWFDEAFRQRWLLVPQKVAAASMNGVKLSSTMALGIAHTDLITTVSPTYASEILTPELGAELDPLLLARRERLFGVLNGIDVVQFNPENDPEIAPNYGLATLERKARVKAALQREASLPEEAAVPLIGVVGRLTEQKGFDLVRPALEALFKQARFQLVVLGTGEPRFHDLLSELAHTHPDQVALYLKFDAALAQRIYAGADIFLMPSRFEPCGLGQLIALRYGTVPVVRATGGLRDTVDDWDGATGDGTGFVFQRYTCDALVVALCRAFETFRHPPSWRQVQENAMRVDSSWDRSARRYVELYERAVSEKSARSR